MPTPRLKKCKSCGSDFPCVVVVDGKRRKLYNREQCLACSPFGAHVTRILEDGKRKTPGVCFCGRKLKSARRNWCSACSVEKRRKKQESRLQSVVGLHCVVCDYGGEGRWRMLDFHHVDPRTKKFCVNKVSMNKPWDVLLAEAKKCF